MKAATTPMLLFGLCMHISIHAAREGGDALGIWLHTCMTLFQSTPPVKAATHIVKKLESLMRISIHAAREGGDVAGASCFFDLL